MRFPPPGFLSASIPRLGHNFMVFQYSRGKGFYLFLKECRALFGQDFSFFGSRYWSFQDFFLFSSGAATLSGIFTMVLTFNSDKYILFSPLFLGLLSKHSKFIFPLAFYANEQLFSFSDFSRLVSHFFSPSRLHSQWLRFFHFYITLLLFTFFFLSLKRFFSFFLLGPHRALLSSSSIGVEEVISLGSKYIK